MKKHRWRIDIFCQVGKGWNKMDNVTKKMEELIAETRLSELLRKRDEDKPKNVLIWILAIVGAVAAVAGIAYAVYCFLTPDYLEDFDEDFDDDYFSDEEEKEKTEEEA